MFKRTTEDFINEANKVHENKYNYDLVIYSGCDNKVKIICPEHGIFEQSPYYHLKGQGCPICKESHGENLVRNILLTEKIEFIREKTFPWLKNKKTQHNLFYDFFLPDFNTAIEYQGEPHFGPIEHFGGIEGFEKRTENDRLKKILSNENNISILYIDYTEKPENIKNKIKGLNNGENFNNRG